MITISLALNAAAITTVTTVSTTVRALANEKFGHANVTAKINGASVGVDAAIGHADLVQLTAIVPAFVPAPAPFQAPVAGGYIAVSYINNDGAGFAEKLTVASGLTIARLIAQKGIDAARFQIRVNGGIATADTVLNNGDKISVTPVKIEGAADILYVNNDGSGFAEKVTVIDGITLRQFFAQRTQSADATRYLIRVNGQAALQDQVLNNGDKVSITPMKIQGA